MWRKLVNFFNEKSFGLFGFKVTWLRLSGGGGGLSGREEFN